MTACGQQAAPTGPAEPVKSASPEIKDASWTDSVKVRGDIRLRFDHTDKEGDPARNRERIRVRLRVDGTVNDEVQAGVGARTGGKDPVSGDQDLTGGFTSKDIALDLAYARWQPKWLPDMTLIGGKMELPFFQASDLVWDNDLNPEGGALRYKLGMGDANLLLNGAVMPVMERSKESDAFIYAGQAGIDFKHASGFNALAGASYYYYSNMEGYDVVDWSDNFKSYGNTAITTRDADGKVIKSVYANEYREVELLAAVGCKCPLTGLPWKFYGNFVHNTQADDNDTGYLAGVQLGKADKPRSFELGYNYRRLEADAVVGAFCDSTSWGGGANGKGHKLSGACQIAKNLRLAAAYFIGELGIKEGETGKDYNRLQVDLSARF